MKLERRKIGLWLYKEEFKNSISWRAFLYQCGLLSDEQREIDKVWIEIDVNRIKVYHKKLEEDKRREIGEAYHKQLEKEKKKYEYGRWTILVTDGDGFWCADRFYYTFRLDQPRQRLAELISALRDAAIQQYRDRKENKKTIYTVIEI